MSGRVPFFSGSFLNFPIVLALAFLVHYIFLKFRPSIVHQVFIDTTRKPRPGEVNGKQYHFVTPQRFKDLIHDGEFIEHAEFSGNLYGTSFDAVRRVEQEGRRCILDIEAQVGLLVFLFLSLYRCSILGNPPN